MMSDAGWLRRTVWWLQDTPQHIRDLPENVRRSVTRAKKSTWDKKPSWEEVREKLEKLHWNYESQRIVFFAVNFLLLIVAVTSVCLGIYLYTARDEYAALTPISFNAMSSAGLLVFTGVTAAIISVVGCTAVYLRNQILVITYTGFICLLAILQIMTGAIGYYEQERSELAVRHDLLLNINSSRITTTLTQRVLIFTWDRLQSTLKCCGADHYKDWFNNVQWPRNEFVPDSCCIADKFEGVEDMVGCGKMTNNRELWYQQGCYPVFSNWLFQHIRIVGTMAGLFVLASFFAIFMGILVYFRLKKEEHLYGPKGPTDAQLQAKIQQELQLDGPETVVKQRVDRIVEVRKRLFEYDNPDPGKDRTKTTMHDFIPSDYEDENECPYRKAARRKFRNPALVARESAEAKRHAQEQGLLDGEHPDEPIPEYIPQDPAEPTQARFPPV